MSQCELPRLSNLDALNRNRKNFDVDIKTVIKFVGGAV